MVNGGAAADVKESRVQNLYYIHLFQIYPNRNDLDETMWLCRTCASKRYLKSSAIQTQYAVHGTEVCECCGAKQIIFPRHAFVERKRIGRGQLRVAGRIAGVTPTGLLAVDWPAPHRIGGDGWHRSYIAFKAVRLANSDRTAAAERWAAQH